MHFVLTVRRQRQDAEEKALSRVLAKMRAAEGRLLDLRSAREHTIEQGRAMLDLVLTGAEYIELDLRRQSLQRSLDQAEAEIKTLDRERLQQNSVYVEARCQREVISELVDERRRVQRAAEDRAEQRRIDDSFLVQGDRTKDNAVRPYNFAEKVRDA